jgi:glycoside/pentoside/hexuronide:cation symporter, GPH family
LSKAKSPVAGASMSIAAVLAFACASIPINAFQLALSVHLPRYFATELGIAVAAVGAIFGLVRLIDLPIDFATGFAMDRTKTPWGRYRVWLLAGAPVFAFGLVMLMQSPAGVGQGYLFGWMLFMYIGYSSFYLAHLAWAGAIAPTYHERSRLFGAITFLGVIGAVSVLAIPILMDQSGYSDAQGVQAMVWFIVAGIPITGLVVALTARDRIAPVHPIEFKFRDYVRLLTKPNILRLLAADMCITLGPGWMAALYLYYFKDSRGFGTAEANLLLAIYIAAGFAGAPFIAWLANRIGKHRAFMVATTVYSLGLIIVPVVPKGAFAIMAPGMFVVGAMQAGFVVMIRALAGDIADEMRLESGRHWMGLVYALTNLTTKAGQALSVILTFSIALPLVGYQVTQGAVNSPGSIRGLEVIFIVGPIVFVMLAGAFFFRYRLTAERHSQIRRELDARDALAQSPTVGDVLAGETVKNPAS